MSTHAAHERSYPRRIVRKDMSAKSRVCAGQRNVNAGSTASIDEGSTLRQLKHRKPRWRAIPARSQAPLVARVAVASVVGWQRTNIGDHIDAIPQPDTWHSWTLAGGSGRPRNQA